MRYKIEVHAVGFDDHALVVDAPSLAKAKAGNNIRRAIIEWCDLNDIDEDSVDLPFTRISKID